MRLTSRSIALFLAIGVLRVVGLASCDATFATEKTKAVIEARAAEIVPMLSDAPDYGAHMVDRSIWDQRATTDEGRRVIAAAEALLDKTWPELPDELYLEYFRNGDRRHYEAVLFELTSGFQLLSMAEVLENKGRFLPKLEEALNYFCSLKTWVWPAHDWNRAYYDGKAVFSDLNSNLTAAHASVALNLLQDKLSPELVEKLKTEIDARILRPFEEAVVSETSNMWWIRSAMNWNAVCFAGTVCAALNTVDSKERRAFFIASAEYYTKRYFLQSFAEDGVCTEGIMYWNYGFGHYVDLGALVRVATKGGVDFFADPKIRAILEYGPQQTIDKNCVVSFADCELDNDAYPRRHPRSDPSPTTVGYLSRLKGWGYCDYERRGLGDGLRYDYPLEVGSIGADVEICCQSTPETQKEQPLPIRSDFSKASVMFCRPDPSAIGRYFAVAFKGGNNEELHNHNDIGSYALVFGSNDPNDPKDSVFICRDPGRETYTVRTFGGDRYKGELCNSFGHPVPRICGKLQSAGAKAKAVVLEKSLSDGSDVVEIDMTSAYSEAEPVKSVKRRFEYKRAFGNDPGYFEVKDAVEFKEGRDDVWETAFITFMDDIAIEEDGDGALVKIAGAVVRANAVGLDGKPQKLVVERAIVGENDASVPRKPTRLAFRVDGKTSGGAITLRYEAE